MRGLAGLLSREFLQLVVLSGLSALFIALLTVSFQALKAALVNPVKTLRSE